MLPFEAFPPRLVIEMVYAAIFWLNAFPHRLGISQDYSPRTIVTGLSIDYKLHCRAEFGEYVQTHEEHDNSMQTRTVGALALRPTGNRQGSFYFYNLNSGLRINRLRWTPLPMPEEVIARVHALARRAKASRGLVFTDSFGRSFDDLYPEDGEDSDDGTYVPDLEDESMGSSDDESNDQEPTRFTGVIPEQDGTSTPPGTAGVDEHETTGVDHEDESDRGRDPNVDAAEPLP